MRKTKYKRPMAAFYPAGVFAVLAVLSLFLAAPGITRTKADPGTGEEALIVLEDSTGSRWSKLSRLNVFANSKYSGQHIIAPMSHGGYTFTVQNSARFPLQYTLKITDENEAGVPMEYRLKQEGKYLAGSENEWADVSALAEISNELPREWEAVYTLEWRWPGDNDEADTSIGAAAQEGMEYLLNFDISAEQSSDPVNPAEPVDSANPVNPNKPADPVKPFAPVTSNDSGKPPQTGDNSDIGFWLAMAITSWVLLILLMILMKRRKTDEENTENT